MVDVVDDLANEIRRVDGSNSLGAGELAEKLWPFIIEQCADFLFQHFEATNYHPDAVPPPEWVLKNVFGKRQES